MSAPENFLTRWSRRKRAESAQQPAATIDESGSRTGSAAQPLAVNAQDGALPAPELAFDLSKLPPIESITAGTDIRGFLAPGVPAELARAALRRAWAADPAIRDFVGLAENSWDFNAPGGIAGFGPLEMTEELRRRIAEMVGRSLATEAPEEPSVGEVERAAPPAIETTAQSPAEPSAQPVQERHGKADSEAVTASEVQRIGAADDTTNKGSDRNSTHVAAQHPRDSGDEQQDVQRKRLHGSALPK